MEQSTDTAEIEQLRADLEQVTARANRDSADLVQVQAERDALKAELDAIQEVVEEVGKIHHRSLFPATSGEDRGKHYCPACTYTDDGWTAYAVWPCPTAVAMETPRRKS